LEKKPEQKHHAWLFVGIILIICFVIYFLMQAKETDSAAPADNPAASPSPAFTSEEPIGRTQEAVLKELEKNGFSLTKEETEDCYLLSIDNMPLSQAKITFSKNQGHVTAFTLEYTT